MNNLKNEIKNDLENKLDIDLNFDTSKLQPNKKSHKLAITLTWQKPRAYNLTQILKLTQKQFP